VPDATLLDPLPRILTLGSLNLIAGASGVGKTAFVAGMATRFRDGHEILGYACNPPPAIGYITADRPWADSLQWFSQVGYADIPQYSIVDDHTLHTSKIRKKLDRTKLLRECIGKLTLPPGSLIFVDPIALFLGGSLNDYDTSAIACIEIHRYALEQRYCLVGIAHASKQKADKGDRYARPQDRINGSTAQLGYTGTQMYLMSPDESGTNFYQFHWNPHHAPAQTFNLRKNKYGLFDGLADGVPADPDLDLNLEHDDTTKRILDVIPPAPAHASSAALILRFTQGQEAISRPTLFRRLGLLQKRGEIESPARGHWRKPAPPAAN